MIKYLIVLIIPFLMGCDSSESDVKNAYTSFCDRQPDSMSCIKHNDIGHTPSKHMLTIVEFEMLRNFTYVTDKEQYNKEEYWFDNVTTSEKLKGDCEDISLTFISQLILDGVNPSTIRLVASGIDGELKHYYVKVKLDSGEYYDFYKNSKYTDIMYMQYDNIGKFITIKEQ